MEVPNRSAVLLALAVALISACSSNEASVRGIETRDSAGVKVVEITEGMDLPTWSIDSLPETVVGERSDDPAHELFRVRAAARFSDGSIAIASQGTSNIRVFDSSGNHVRTFGRQGRGPGEFAFLAGMIISGDTLYAYDLQQQRVSVFSLTGEVLQTIHLPFTRAGSVGRLPDGSFVSTSFLGGLPSRPPGIQRDTTAIEVIHPSGTKNTIVEAIALEWYSLGDNGVPIVLPLGKRTFVTVSGKHVVVAVSDQADIRKYSSGGVLEQVVRIGRGPQAATDEDWEWAKVVYVADFPQERRQEAEERWAQVPRAKHRPMFRSLLATSDGDTWIREFSSGSSGSTWLVIQPDGLPWGRVHVPTGIILLQASRHRVVALRNTDDGQVVTIRKLLK